MSEQSKQLDTKLAKANGEKTLKAVVEMAAKYGFTLSRHGEKLKHWRFKNQLVGLNFWPRTGTVYKDSRDDDFKNMRDDDDDFVAFLEPILRKIHENL